MTLDELKIKSNGARKEIFDDYKNCAEYRWINKPIKEKKELFNGKDLENVQLIGRGSISLSSKFSSDNKFNLCVQTNTDIEGVVPRPSTSIKFSFDHLNLERFNRMSVKIYIESTGYQNFYTHFLFGNDDALTNHAPIVIPNQWNYITWETDHIKRNDINQIKITPYLMGCPPEALPVIKIYIANISAELVEKEFDEGWNLENRIAYCHSGYLPVSKKYAIVSQTDAEYFTVTNSITNKVYKYKVKEKDYHLGHFYVLDFSNVTEMGKYYLEIDNRKTEEFLIDYVCYDSSIWKSLNFLRLLRCGEDIEGVHSPCHLNCKSVHPNGKMVPNFGGWHDAGDVSQFEICTAEMANAILDLAITLKADTFLYERLLEEAKVGLNFLLRTRFGDGYRANAITYSIWRKNILSPDNTTIYNNKAEVGAFENFLASSAEAVGARLFDSSDKVFSEWCKRSAIEDFKFAEEEYENNIYTPRWGPTIESQTGGAACLAACELYALTNDPIYLEKAYYFAQIVMDCQEKGSDDVPLKGFFYEDKEHKYILTYEHRGHEQSPIQGIARLYQLENDYNKKTQLKKSLDLYADYVMKTINYTKPYYLLPGHIYHINKINLQRFTIPPKTEITTALESLVNQIKSGIDLGDGWYLRIMPIAVSRRGYHATLLSKTKAVSMIAKTLQNVDLKNVVISQLEWILGKNPFSSSTMYGEGHNYHPLYVAFSRQMVGALPVGIKTKGNNDIPYWPTVCNSVYKEIWGHTTGKYLWILADIL